jgi:hypothetical protein
LAADRGCGTGAVRGRRIPDRPDRDYQSAGDAGTAVSIGSGLQLVGVIATLVFGVPAARAEYRAVTGRLPDDHREHLMLRDDRAFTRLS